MPSSPALPDDADIPSSPPLLPQHQHIHIPRKRHLRQDDNLSSDPLFSEDMSESDDHPGQRRKRQYRGSWWQHPQPASRPAQGRKLMKFADSGVWLASESSDDSMLGTETDAAPQELDVANSQSLRSRDPSPQSYAEQIVNDCLDTNTETIDLANLTLVDLPCHVVRPLQHLIRRIEHPDSDNYAPLSPDLKVFLGNNGLRTLPSALWDLEYLAVLSLRSNSIKELPSAVGRLKRLKELNISGNELRWLPWELLKLLRTGSLMLTPHPNPLWAPRAGLESTRNAAALKYQETLHAKGLKPVRQDTPAIFCGASRKRYYAVDGTLDAESRSLPSPWAAEGWQVEPEGDDRAAWTAASSAQSLFENASKIVRRYLTQVPVSDRSIPPVRKAIMRCEELQHQHEPSCSVCGRDFLFQRAEWVEYWYCNVSGMSKPPNFYMLPFMRRACSLGCAAQAAASRNE